LGVGVCKGSGLEACLSVGIETHKSAQAVPYDLAAQIDTEITTALERLSPPDCDCSCSGYILLLLLLDA